MALDQGARLSTGSQRSLEVCNFPSAKYHPTKICPLFKTPNIYIWGRGDNKRAPIYILIDPKSSVESISEVPRASKAHLEVVNWPIT